MIRMLVVAVLLASLAMASLAIAPPAIVEAASLPSTPPAATPAPPPPAAQTPGNPANPGDFTGNPHPDMLWFGVPTPYGQFLRWVWVPPAFANVDGRIVERPGYWVAVTTAGYYVVDHWELAQGPTGERVWRMVPAAFQPR
jgi:hypothetical protein